VNEKLIERKLREAVRKAGGQAIKFFAPSFTGLPDRIVLMPGGRIWFAELKTTGKKLEPRQRVVHKLLLVLGFEVRTIDTQERLTDFLKEINT
jgi:hypothetical protein